MNLVELLERMFIFFGRLSILIGVLFLMQSVFTETFSLLLILSIVQQVFNGLIFLGIANGIAKKQKWAWYIAFVFCIIGISYFIAGGFFIEFSAGVWLSLFIQIIIFILLLKVRKTFIEQSKEEASNNFHDFYFLATVALIIVMVVIYGGFLGYSIFKKKELFLEKQFFSQINNSTPVKPEEQSVVKATSTETAIYKNETSDYCPDILKDIDDNVYNTVRIGEQCWLKENLKVTKNPAGEAITRYCYDNDPKICDTDGGLYDWNTAMNNSTAEGAQGICMTGWHVPKDSEWYVLENGLKDEGQTCFDKRTLTKSLWEDAIWSCATAGTKLKLKGSSGFEAVLAGHYGIASGSFIFRRLAATFWSSTKENESLVWTRSLRETNSTVNRFTYDKNKPFGFSVRCLKD